MYARAHEPVSGGALWEHPLFRPQSKKSSPFALTRFPSTRGQSARRRQGTMRGCVFCERVALGRPSYSQCPSLQPWLPYCTAVSHFPCRNSTRADRTASGIRRGARGLHHTLPRAVFARPVQADLVSVRIVEAGMTPRWSGLQKPRNVRK